MAGANNDICLDAEQFVIRARDILCGLAQIDDGEFHSITGKTRAELKAWVPRAGVWTKADVETAVVVLNNLIGYPHDSKEDIERGLRKPFAFVELLVQKMSSKVKD